MFCGLFLFAKNMIFLTKGGIHCNSRSSLGLLFYARAFSFVELTEHDNSAADIMVHSMYIYILLYSRYIMCTRYQVPIVNGHRRGRREESRTKHQIQPEYGNEQADAGWACRTRLARPTSRENSISLFN